MNTWQSFKEGLVWYCKIFFEAFSLILKIIYNIIESWVRFSHTPRKDLSREIVLLTGAAGGFGELLSEKLARKGCKLVLIDIDGEKLGTLNQYLSTITDTISFRCDITKPEEIRDVAEQLRNTIGHPSIVINNAGIVAGKYFEDLTPGDVGRTFDVNTLAHYSIIRQFLPYMMEQNHGHIVSISSILGVSPAGGLCEYAASKAAATAFMYSLRQELRLKKKDKIFFTNVLPFQVHTNLFKGCETRFPKFPFMSVQDPYYVTDKIVEAIEKNQIVIYIPRILYLMTALYHIFPVAVFDVIYDFFCVNSAMKTHVGHNKNKF